MILKADVFTKIILVFKKNNFFLVWKKDINDPVWFLLTWQLWVKLCLGTREMEDESQKCRYNHPGI